MQRTQEVLVPPCPSKLCFLLKPQWDVRPRPHSLFGVTVYCGSRTHTPGHHGRVPIPAACPREAGFPSWSWSPEGLLEGQKGQTGQCPPEDAALGGGEPEDLTGLGTVAAGSWPTGAFSRTHIKPIRLPSHQWHPRPSHSHLASPPGPGAQSPTLLALLHHRLPSECSLSLLVTDPVVHQALWGPPDVVALSLAPSDLGWHPC